MATIESESESESFYKPNITISASGPLGLLYAIKLRELFPNIDLCRIMVIANTDADINKKLRNDVLLLSKQVMNVLPRKD